MTGTCHCRYDAAAKGASLIRHCSDQVVGFLFLFVEILPYKSLLLCSFSSM